VDERRDQRVDLGHLGGIQQLLWTCEHIAVGGTLPEPMRFAPGPEQFAATSDETPPWEEALPKGGPPTGETQPEIGRHWSPKESHVRRKH
jgi:hypothetical protein